jgi:hypothetical protein
MRETYFTKFVRFIQYQEGSEFLLVPKTLRIFPIFFRLKTKKILKVDFYVVFSLYKVDTEPPNNVRTDNDACSDLRSW